jgi:heat shock protein HtpX
VTALWNILKAWLFLCGILALFGLVGYLVGGYRVAWVFCFAGLLLGLGTYWIADRAVMGTLGARELPEGEDPALHATVAALAGRAGVVKPRLYVIEKGPPLALAGGRGALGSSLAVTASLIALPAPAEIEGVIAHELAHIRRRDIVVQTPVVMLSTALIDLSRIGGFLERPLLFVLGPIAAAIEHLMLSPKRELGADRLGAEICSSPHGLADALIRLEQTVGMVEFEGNPATEPLYTINPFEERGLAAMFITHPPVSDRVRRLRDLDPEWRERLRTA